MLTKGEREPPPRPSHPEQARRWPRYSQLLAAALFWRRGRRLFPPHPLTGGASRSPRPLRSPRDSNLPHSLPAAPTATAVRRDPRRVWWWGLRGGGRRGLVVDGRRGREDGKRRWRHGGRGQWRRRADHGGSHCLPVVVDGVDVRYCPDWWRWGGEGAGWWSSGGESGDGRGGSWRRSGGGQGKGERWQRLEEGPRWDKVHGRRRDVPTVK